MTDNKEEPKHEGNGEWLLLGYADEADNYPLCEMREEPNGDRYVRVGGKATT